MRPLATALAGLAPMLVAVLAAPAPAAPPPRLAVDQVVAAVGSRITVTLSGWPAGMSTISLCGNGGRRGSADCAVTDSTQSYVTDSGRTQVRLAVVVPPAPCPCVVRAGTLDGRTIGTLPIAIIGLAGRPAGSAAGLGGPAEPGGSTTPPGGSAAEPTVSTAEPGGSPEPDGFPGPADDPGARLTVVDVALVGGWSWPALFGGPARRTLVVTVRNDGAVAVDEPALSVTMGRGERPTGYVAAPPVGTIGPARQHTIRLPVTIPAPAAGRYTLRGELDGPLIQPVAFGATMTSYPWGLLLAGAVLVGGLIVRELRARRPGAHPRGEPAPGRSSAGRAPPAAKRTRGAAKDGGAATEGDVSGSSTRR